MDEGPAEVDARASRLSTGGSDESRASIQQVALGGLHVAPALNETTAVERPATPLCPVAGANEGRQPFIELL